MQRILCFCGLWLFSHIVWAATASSYLPDLQKQYQTASLVSAEFIQRKQLKFIESDLISTGMMRFAKNHGFIWQLDTPFFAKTIFLSSAIYKIDAKGRVSQERDQGSKAIAKMLQSLLSGDWQGLDNMFKVAQYKAGDEWSLKLVAAQPWMARVIENIILYGNDNTINRVEIIDTNKNISHIELKNIQTQNTPLTQAQEADFATAK